MKKYLSLFLVLFLLAACQPAEPEATDSPAANNPPDQVEPTAAATDAPLPETEATSQPETVDTAPEAGPVCGDAPASADGGDSVRVVFTNEFSEPLDVVNKDSAGEEHLVFSLDPGQSILHAVSVGEVYCFDLPLGPLAPVIEPTLIELVAGMDYIDTIYSDAEHELAEIQLYDYPECRLRSRDTENQDPIDVNYVNASSRAVTVYWVDWDGNLTEDPFTVEPGATEFIPGVGHLHAWCVKDAQTGEFVYQNFTLAGVSDFVIPSAGMNEAVTLTLSLESFCREGPGPEYAEVGVISTDELIYVVGVPAENGYPWVVVLDNMAGATCWLWTEHATIEGDLSKLPKVPIPPAP